MKPIKRLTAAEVAVVRVRYAAGATQIALAREYGVSQTSISRYVRGEEDGGDCLGRPPGFAWPDRVCAGCGCTFSPRGSVQRFCRPECVPATRVCYQCKRDLGRDDYYRKPDGSLLTPCKECRREINRAAWSSRSAERQQADALAHWERSLRLKFHMLPADYWRVHEEQDGRCRICHRTLEEIASTRFFRFCVDHDRRCCPGDISCGKCVRGLLCTKCNGSVGWFEQFSAEIRAYLEEVVQWQASVP